MRLGKLDRRVEVLRKVVTRNDNEEDIESWVTVTTLWCEKKDVTGNERFVAQQFLSEVDTLFTTHYSRDYTPLNRLRHEGRDYDILAVLEIGRREGISINTRARSENPPV